MLCTFGDIVVTVFYKCFSAPDARDVPSAPLGKSGFEGQFPMKFVVNDNSIVVLRGSAPMTFVESATTYNAKGQLEHPEHREPRNMLYNLYYLNFLADTNNRENCKS